MNTQTLTTFFALLALACNVATLGLIGVWAGGRRSPRLAEVRQRLRYSRGAMVGLAWLVALAAMLGSLYYSEVAHFEPCRLCWYQRITMYPLTAVLLVGLLRREAAVRFYAYPLAIIGGALAAYHWLVQRFPDLDAGTCSVGIPCTAAWVEKFGFITIPYMAFSAFAVIAALLAVAATAAEDRRPPQADESP